MCSKIEGQVRKGLRGTAKRQHAEGQLHIIANFTLHYHIVMLIDRESALMWSLEEVLERWTQLFSGPLLVTRYLSDARGQMTGAEIAKVRELGEAYRIGIDPERFIGYSEHMLKAFGTAVGAPAAMANLCVRRQTKYLRGIKAARQIFKAPRAA